MGWFSDADEGNQELHHPPTFRFPKQKESLFLRSEVKR